MSIGGEVMKPTEQSKKYHVVFKNKFVSDVNPKDVQKRFVLKYKVPEKSCDRIFSGCRVRIKKGITQKAALDLQDNLFKIGMLCDIEIDMPQKPTQKITSEKASKALQKNQPSVQDEDEEDDDDVEADFDLAEILMQTETNSVDKNKGNSIVEIIKSHKNNIIDIQYLQKNEKYIEPKNHFCLAELDRKNNVFFYYDDFIQGICYDSKQKALETESLRVNANMYHKKKRIYRHLVPEQGHVILTNDLYTYSIRKKPGLSMPPKKIPKKPGSAGLKHFFRSIFCHLLIIVLIGLFVSFDKPNKVEPKRFATIAGNKIHDLQKLRKKQREMNHPKKREMVQLHLKKTKTRINETKPVKKVQKKLAKTNRFQKLVPKKNIAKNINKKKKLTTAGKLSTGKTGRQLVTKRSNRKGYGGKDIGNVSTPDVHQKGILGMIKDTGLSLLNTEALAAVSQLDTVKVPGNFDKNTLKINGIKGHLGDRKVHMPLNSGGGRVNTKGAHQVLRTGGGEGTGEKGSGARVGELAKGNTGNNAVKAMIRANFKQSVHQIQGGGMSRAAVKKVIDQHIDDITYCYEVALISDPSIVGKAVYEWRILMNGSVGDVHILNASIQNQEILGCIKKSIKTWTFPQPHKAQVLVSYPFVFDIVGF